MDGWVLKSELQVAVAERMGGSKRERIALNPKRHFKADGLLMALLLSLLGSRTYFQGGMR
jgi:hypothetical protein